MKINEVLTALDDSKWLLRDRDGNPIQTGDMFIVEKTVKDRLELSFKNILISDRLTADKKICWSNLIYMPMESPLFKNPNENGKVFWWMGDLSILIVEYFKILENGHIYPFIFRKPLLPYNSFDTFEFAFSDKFDALEHERIDLNWLKSIKVNFKSGTELSGFVKAHMPLKKDRLVEKDGMLQFKLEDLALFDSLKKTLRGVNSRKAWELKHGERYKIFFRVNNEPENLFRKMAESYDSYEAKMFNLYHKMNLDKFYSKSVKEEDRNLEILFSRDFKADENSYIEYQYSFKKGKGRIYKA